MTLTEFLLARIDEDEGRARAHLAESGDPHLTAVFPALRLAVIEMEPRGGLTDDGARMDRALRYLALGWADHVDYRQEWRP